MKKAAFLTITAVLLAISLPVFAQEFPDVPPDHWAYGALDELVSAGIIQGYPDGTYGGKRAMSRYEFAEALAKAIPAIEERITAVAGGVPGPAGPPGPPGPAGAPGAGAEEVAAVKKLIDEFGDELAAIGVDVEALRRDVAALSERVTALEEEVARVRITGEVNVIARGEVDNAGSPLDRDSRELATGAATNQENNPLADSDVFVDLDLAIDAKVSEDVSVRAVINAGDYLTNQVSTPDDFTLLNLYAEAPVRLGPLGTAQLVAGRLPFQLTPLTLKLVDPDSYTNVTKLDSGDYILDGATASFNLGKVALTAFGGKTNDQIADLLTPDVAVDGEISGIAGVRAVIGTSSLGNIGLTYYQGAPSAGRIEVLGGDINTDLGSIGVAAEYAQTEPSDALSTARQSDNAAWNANLSYQAGKLGIGAGYSNVETNFQAPGSWSRLGRAVNLTNIKGPSVNLTYALSPRVSLTAEGQFLEPDQGTTITGRTATSQALGVSAGSVDKVTALKAGVKYALSDANSVDLGYEQVKWEPTSGTDAEERYITIGIGHTLNPNASLKLLYQIVEYEEGTSSPYASTADYRGGVATAQLQCKF